MRLVRHDAADVIGVDQMISRYGVSLQTIRYYETLGLLHPTWIGSRSFYTPKDEKRLEVILKGESFGFSLAEITVLLGELDARRGPAGRGE